MLNLGRHMRQYIRDKRRAKHVDLMARASEKFLRAYYNENFWEFSNNGERFALTSFARWSDAGPVVWDVGANKGQWAAQTRQLLPSAIIHSFEILPPIADAWEERLGGTKAIHLHRVGLSDKAGTVDVTWNRDCDVASAIDIRRHGGPGGNFASMSCPVSTIDRMMAEERLPAPVLLKIDTEGHDAAVLRGASGLLSSDEAPAMIQFEYGETWLPAGKTLERVQEQLETHGYRVGRLYPNHGAVKSHEYSDDRFRMGNMVAARPEALVKVLAAT